MWGNVMFWYTGYVGNLIFGPVYATKLPAAGDLELEEVSGFVTCSYNSQWWLGCVLETHTKEVQISLTLLHPHSPSRSYPDVPVIVTLPLTEILIKICPRSQTGHVYTLTQRLKLQRKLERIDFLSLLHVLFCQCALYYVCVNVLQRTCLNNYFNISWSHCCPKTKLVPHKAR